MTASHGGPVITELIDEATVTAIAEEAWIALVGDDEVLVPLAAELPADALSSWVDVVGPWTGAVVLTTGRDTAAELCRALLGASAQEVLEQEDVDDAFGEMANVVGGNVKASLPGPSSLGLPEVGDAPAVRNAGDLCRVHVLWRGEPVSISVQGALPARPQGILPALPDPSPHTNGASL